MLWQCNTLCYGIVITLWYSNIITLWQHTLCYGNVIWYGIVIMLH